MLPPPLPGSFRFVVFAAFSISFACTPRSEPAAEDAATKADASTEEAGRRGPGGGGGGGEGQGQMAGSGKGRGPGGLRKNRGQHCPVYIDGEPVALLSYAELPRGLEPVWLEQTRYLPFKPGEERKSVTERVPRYRLVDYLARLRIPLDKLKAAHFHHGRGMIAEVTGKGLAARPDSVMFRFGGDTHGKTIPVFHDDAPVNRRFDHMVALTLYVDKAPPTLNEDDKPVLFGEPVEGIAYNTEPLKNGARIYLDDRIALVLNRKLIGSEGKLARLLALQGTAPDRVAYGVLIANGERSEPVEPEKLLKAPLTRDDQARGFAIALDGSEATLDAIALYTSKPE